jgi:alkane 1-monooxygenase
LAVRNVDLDATDDDLYWYRFITIIWAPLQFITVFSLIAYITDT